jgi:hypothetical protein
VTGAGDPPPDAVTFFSVVPVQNPIDSPSGEKNGASAPSVPGIGVASLRSRSREYSCGVLFPEPVNTTRRPSGEIAIEVWTGRI